MADVRNALITYSTDRTLTRHTSVSLRGARPRRALRRRAAHADQPRGAPSHERRDAAERPPRARHDGGRQRAGDRACGARTRGGGGGGGERDGTEEHGELLDGPTAPGGALLRVARVELALPARRGVGVLVELQRALLRLVRVAG